MGSDNKDGAPETGREGVTKARRSSDSRKAAGRRSGENEGRPAEPPGAETSSRGHGVLAEGGEYSARPGGVKSEGPGKNGLFIIRGRKSDARDWGKIVILEKGDKCRCREYTGGGPPRGQCWSRGSLTKRELDHWGV